MDDINSIIYAIHPSDTLDELKENRNNNYWVSIDEVRLLELMNLVWQENTMWTRLLLISIAEAFSSINPFYLKEKMQNMLYEHLRLTTIEVNARLKGDYVADINAYDMVQNEILKMSSFFVNGIIEQFPDLF